MDNISLKSIQFPGLGNVYTVPQMDDQFATYNKAADAKLTGEITAALKNGLLTALSWEVGNEGKYIRFSDGAAPTNAYFNATKYLDVSGYDYIAYTEVVFTSADPVGGIAFYSDKTVGSYISGVQSDGGATALHYAMRYVPVPYGALYARLTMFSTVGDFGVWGITNVGEKLSGHDTSIASLTSGQAQLSAETDYLGEEFVNTVGGNGTYRVEPITWAYGDVTTSGGIDNTNTAESVSGYFSIGDYDYIDVINKSQGSYGLIVYSYDGTNYSTPEVGARYQPVSAFRLTDKTLQYIVRVKNLPLSVNPIDLTAVANAIEVRKGRYSDVADLDSLGDSEYRVKRKLDLPFSIGTVDSTNGFSSDDHNIVTAPFSIADYDKLVIEYTPGTGFRYAVYTLSNGTFANASGGWATGRTEYTDKTVQYVVRVGRSSGSAAYDYQAAVAAQNTVGVYGVICGGTNYGYSRDYNDVTFTLAFERKDISVNGIEDSTTSLIAKIPNRGNVECRLNSPGGKFSVWKVSGSTYTQICAETFYQYRFTGDYESDYYVRVANPTDTTISLSGSNIVNVYIYDDTGINWKEETALSGKSIAVFGDSIVQGRMAKNGNSVNYTMPKPYSNILAERANTEPNNFGIGGALVYNNNWKSLVQHYSDISGFDVVFICAGTNDFGSGIALADFSSAYQTVLEGLIASNTEVVVCTPTRRGTDSTNSDTGLNLQAYATEEISIAETLNVDVIDLYTLTNTTTFKANLNDGLHPNEVGAKIIGDMILSEYNSLHG